MKLTSINGQTSFKGITPDSGFFMLDKKTRGLVKEVWPTLKAKYGDKVFRDTVVLSKSSSSDPSNSLAVMTLPAGIFNDKTVGYSEKLVQTTNDVLSTVEEAVAGLVRK